MWACASFKPKGLFTWGGVLENNINHILEPHLKLKLLGWDGYLRKVNLQL